MPIFEKVEKVNFLFSPPILGKTVYPRLTGTKGNKTFILSRLFDGQIQITVLENNRVEFESIEDDLEAIEIHLENYGAAIDFETLLNFERGTL